MKFRDERSTFVIQAQSLKESVVHLYPDLPGVPSQARGPVSRKHGNFSGPKANFKI